MATGDKKNPLHSVRLEASIQEVWQRQADMQHSMRHTGRSPAQVSLCYPATPQHLNRAEVPYLARLAAQIKTKTKNKKSVKSTPAANVTRPNPDGKQSSRSASLWCWGKRSSEVK
jgi:hypothetical protein